ncbi:DUF4270 family protein [Lacinutrix undariae]
MKKIAIQVLVLLTIICCSMISCSSDIDTTVGEDMVTSNTRVYYIDTLTVATSTFQYDSLSVSETNRLLLGAYTDPVLGLTKSNLYAHFGYTTADIDNDANFDSIAMILNYDNYFYNDTTAIQELNVYRVTQTIRPDDNSVYYNTTDFEKNPTSLGSLSFYPKPIKEDSLEIKMSNDFGQTLFDEIQDNEFSSFDEMLNEYKGFVVEPSETNTTILGFLKTSYFRIYYTIPDGSDDIEYTYDISFDTSNSFHNITSDKTGTYLEDIVDQESYIQSSNTGNNTFIQGGTGIVTRLDIPYLETIGRIPGEGTITGANLSLTLKRNSYNDNLSTRDSLGVFIIDQKSEILMDLFQYDTSTAYGEISNEDNGEFTTVNYNIPIKLFLDLKLTDTNRENLFLAIYGQGLNDSVDRYIINSEDEDDEIKLKLELTYAVYDEE